MEQLNAIMEVSGNEFTVQNLGLYAIILTTLVKGPDAINWTKDKFRSISSRHTNQYI